MPRPPANTAELGVLVSGHSAAISGGTLVVACLSLFLSTCAEAPKEDRPTATLPASAPSSVQTARSSPTESDIPMIVVIPGADKGIRVTKTPEGIVIMPVGQ